MKELQPIQKDRTEVYAVKPVKKEQRLIGRMVPQPGQKVWELNFVTGVYRQLTENDYETSVATVKNWSVTKGNINPGIAHVTKKIIIRENCMYEIALNEKNAVRKFKNRINNIVKMAKG